MSASSKTTTVPPECIGHLGYLTEAQTSALNDFLGQVPSEDIEISKFNAESLEQASLRYLRARGFNVSKALEMISECKQKKIQGNAKQYAQMTPEECTQCDLDVLTFWYPHTQRGFDRFDRPILFESSGRIDLNALNQVISRENLINYHWWTMEHNMNQIFQQAVDRAQANGIEKPSLSTCVILDLADITSSHCSSKMMDHLKTIISIDNICYPEVLGKMFVLNAPWIAVQAWGIVKGWLDPRTQAKIEILSSGPEALRRLQEVISPEQLPPEYGGTGPALYSPKPNTEFLTVPAKGGCEPGGGGGGVSGKWGFSSSKNPAVEGGVIRKLVVPPGWGLLIDSYVTDSVPLELKIEWTEVTPPPPPTEIEVDTSTTATASVSTTSTPSTKSSFFSSFSSKSSKPSAASSTPPIPPPTTIAPPTYTLHSTQQISSPTSPSPTRVKIVIPPEDPSPSSSSSTELKEKEYKITWISPVTHSKPISLAFSYSPLPPGSTQTSSISSSTSTPTSESDSAQTENPPPTTTTTTSTNSSEENGEGVDHAIPTSSSSSTSDST